MEPVKCCVWTLGLFPVSASLWVEFHACPGGKVPASYVRKRAGLCCLLRTMLSRGVGSKSRAVKVAVSKTTASDSRHIIGIQAQSLLDLAKATKPVPRFSPLPPDPCLQCFFFKQGSDNTRRHRNGATLRVRGAH
ncbi:hypothetical protein V8C26DRAFT_350771 [Trichoderma gracile]